MDCPISHLNHRRAPPVMGGASHLNFAPVGAVRFVTDMLHPGIAHALRVTGHEIACRLENSGTFSPALRNVSYHRRLPKNNLIPRLCRSPASVMRGEFHLNKLQ